MDGNGCFVNFQGESQRKLMGEWSSRGKQRVRKFSIDQVSVGYRINVDVLIVDLIPVAEGLDIAVLFVGGEHSGGGDWRTGKSKKLGGLPSSVSHPSPLIAF